MDTEIKIKQLEEEIRHEKEMRRLQADRLNAHDVRMAAFETRHAQAVAEHDREMKELRTIVGDIAIMLKNFIDSMQGGTKNGKES